MLKYSIMELNTVLHAILHLLTNNYKFYQIISINSNRGNLYYINTPSIVKHKILRFCFFNELVHQTSTDPIVKRCGCRIYTFFIISLLSTVGSILSFLFRKPRRFLNLNLRKLYRGESLLELRHILSCCRDCIRTM